MKFNNVTAVIQAGGRSSRMGRDKALVQLADKAMVQHVVDAVSQVSSNLLLVTNNRVELAYLDLPMMSDADPGAGALPGLLTALQAATDELVLLVAVDMPFVAPRLLSHMVEIIGDADAVVPRWENRFQPTCAVYRRKPCMQAVEMVLGSGKRRMISWFDAVKIREVDSAEIRQFDPDGRTFFNINTPADLAQAERMFS